MFKHRMMLGSSVGKKLKLSLEECYCGYREEFNRRVFGQGNRDMDKARELLYPYWKRAHRFLVITDDDNKLVGFGIGEALRDSQGKGLLEGLGVPADSYHIAGLAFQPKMWSSSRGTIISLIIRGFISDAEELGFGITTILDFYGKKWDQILLMEGFEEWARYTVLDQTRIVYQIGLDTSPCIFDALEHSRHPH